MRIEKKIWDSLRDCVKKALSEGCEGWDYFNKMRHAITVELLRLKCEPLEVKDVLTGWNKKCKPQLNPAQERDYLHKYVDWAVAKQCKVGCKALESYCIGKEICQFYLRVTYKNRQQTKNIPFDRSELSHLLDNKYRADAHLMMILVNVLRYHQIEKATGEVILISLRKIQSIIRDRYRANIDLMTIRRKLYRLMEEGVIQQVVKGKPGTFFKQANGYRFLPWRPSTAPECSSPANNKHGASDDPDGCSGTEQGTNNNGPPTQNN